MKKRAGSAKPRSASAYSRTGRPKGKATTVRLDPRLQPRLERLQKILKKPANKLIGEAVEEFIERRTAEIEAGLESLLAQVKAYRRQDASFDAAIGRFVDAEATLGDQDPAEGVVEAETVDTGPAQKMIRELLSR